MFSPILATLSEIASATLMLPAFAARILLTSGPAPSATSAIILTRPWNRLVARDKIGLGIHLDDDAFGT